MRIRHRLTALDANAHLVEVETTVSGDDIPSPLELAMPVWTPGSYLVREYARHVEGMSSPAYPVRKVRKNAWRVDHDGAREVTVRYRVYCNDLSVRTNHVDASHVYVNGAATFVFVPGRLDTPTEVEIAAPAGWRVATALQKDGAVLRAPDADTLMDSPIEVGTHREEMFLAAGKTHTYAVWPHDAIREPNVTRLVEATKTIVETEARLFGGLPHDGYTFILHLSPRGRGGLEHMASSTLLAPAHAFDTRDGWLDLLSLIAHEYFHLWNVKRIRPAGLSPYRYEEENYTRLLWWFEGATSYYDWRVLRLAKLCSVEEYLDHLASEVVYLDQTPGRLVHALEEASFDAWIKLYRPDENSPNSTVSYYRKGELVCALLDLEIRARTEGRASLDRVLAALWERFGSRGVPVPEDAMQGIFEQTCETSLGDLFDAWVRSPGEVDPVPTLARAGLGLDRTPKTDGPSLGLRTRSDGGRVWVTHALRGAAGQRAGIDVGDEVLAIADRRVDNGVDAALSHTKAGETVTVLVSRDARVRAVEVTPDAPRQDRVRIVARKDATSEQKALCELWLGELHPLWK
jgi:predicted metalloprotease with PDZ domain